MIIYRFLSQSAALFLLVIYQKLYYINKDKLPPKEEGAVVFAVNHPTAFTDSFIFMVYSHIKCYFMLRGDYFRVSKVVRWFMDQIRLIPVFRKRDGFSALKQNQDFFDLFYEIMHEGKDISIMVEGSHDHRKRLRKVQRGLARIVFGTYDKYGDTNMTIVPIGLTYSDVTKFRASVSICVGDPILVADYIPLHQENPRQALLKLTKDVQKAMQPLLVHVEKEEDDWLADQLLDMNRNGSQAPLFPPYSSNPEPLQKEIALVNQLNHLTETDKASLLQDVQSYQSKLAAADVKDLGVARRKEVNFNTTLLIIFGAPIFLIGFVGALVPILITRKVLSNVKKPEFVTSMMLVGAMFGYIFYFILLLIIAIFVGKWWFWISVLALPFISYTAILYRDIFLRWQAVRKFRALPNTEKEELVKMRKRLLQLKIRDRVLPKL